MENFIASLFPKTIKALQEDFFNIKDQVKLQTDDTRSLARDWVRSDIAPAAKKTAALFEDIVERARNPMARSRSGFPWGRMVVGLGVLGLAGYAYSRREVLAEKWEELQEGRGTRATGSDQRRQGQRRQPRGQEGAGVSTATADLSGSNSASHSSASPTDTSSIVDSSAAGSSDTGSAGGSSKIGASSGSGKEKSRGGRSESSADTSDTQIH
jgi:hypothetical protein